MIIEKIIFNLLAFTLFTIIFIKMVKKNDTVYIDLLVIQFIGIAINFIELISSVKLPIVIKVLLYVICVILPLIVIIIEKKKILFPEALNIMLAKFFLAINNKENAKKYMLKLVDKYPNSYYGHKMLAELYEEEGKYTNSMDEFVRAIEINGKDYDSYYKIAVLLNKLNNNQASIDMLNDLLKKKPEYTQASMLLGDILYTEERFKEASQVYAEALKYNPENYDIYYNLGMVYTRLNDFKKAKEYYQIAAEVNSMLYNAKFNLAQIAMIYGDLEDAEKFFMECLAKEDIESGSYYYLAQINMLRGEKEKAVNYLNIAIELDKDIYKEVQSDELFKDIRKEIRMPNLNDTLKLPIINRLTKKEKITQNHLKETYKLVNKLSGSQIEEKEETKEKEAEEIEREEK